MRTHISLPEELVDEVDKLAGKRKRSSFIEEAVRAKVRQAKLLALIDAQLAKPPLDPENRPHLAPLGKSSEWVHESRELDRRLEKEKLGSWLDVE